jgi:hypothetical protein
VAVPEEHRHAVEIGPLFALEPEDVARRADRPASIRGPVYLGD